MVDSVLPPTLPTAPASAPIPATVMSPATAEAAETLARLAAAGATSLEGTLTATTAQPGATARIALPDGSFLDLKIPPSFSASPGATLTFQFQQQAGGGFVLRLAAINGRATAGTPATTLTTAPGGAGLLPLPAAPVPTAVNPNGGALSTAGPQPGHPLGTPGQAGLSTPTVAPALLADGLPGLTATVLRPGAAPQPGGSGGLVQPGTANPLATMAAGGPIPSPGLASASAVPTAWTTLAPGTQLPLRLAEARPAENSGLPAAPAPPGAMPGPAAAGATAPTAAPTGTAASLAPPSPSAPLILTGRVLANSIPGGGALVQTEAGLLSLPSGLSLPVGGMVRLEVVGPPLPPPPAPAPLAPGLGTGGWPALSEALELLTRSDLRTAEVLLQAIPQSGPRLAAALAQFAVAIRQGESRLPGGESTQRGLDKIGRHDLAERLRGDLKSLSEEAVRPKGATGEWQTLTMPFLNGAQIDPIRLHVQTPQQDEENRRGGSGGEKRFILDVEMSRLGRIQFDGLVLRESKRFDLIVRTRQPLDSVICRDIAGIFAECAQLTGIKGGVSFQAGRAFVELPPSPPAAATSLMV